MPLFYEFFAGGGMARAGLGKAWRCIFANDFDHKKGRVYAFNWGPEALRTADIRTLRTSDLPSVADLAWASFPCQDLSLAGAGAGLKGDRSGTFWPFWSLINSLIAESRAPRLLVLENVCGTLSSHEGKDFAAICDSLNDAGYKVGAIVVNASLFVPQSRPRLFVIGVRRDISIPEKLIGHGPSNPWHTRTLKLGHSKLMEETRSNWIWWNLPLPAPRKFTFADIIEDRPTDVRWFSKEETEELLAMMSPLNIAKMQSAMRQGQRIVGGVYKRTRPNGSGKKVQRAEVRFDDVSGCLRTPAGGSSRQVIVIVDGSKVKARLISSRETARLMGLPDTYVLPANYNEAYHLTGDGVVVPVVRYLADKILEPVLGYATESKVEAA